jgi:protein farnesyltransferase/geranylgeranyltransferase type-1 subunit alpha
MDDGCSGVCCVRSCEVAVVEGGKAQAAEALDLLAKTYDPIRKNYWEYRKGLLGVQGVIDGAVAA